MKVSGFTFRSPLRWLGCCLAAVVLVAGAPSRASAGVIEYFRDRGEDLLDVFRLRFMVPYRAEGYGLKARVTSLAQAGYVHFNGSAFGMDRRAIGQVHEKRTEGGVSVVYFSRTQMEKVRGNDYLDSDAIWNQAAPRGIMRRGSSWDDGRLHPVSVGAEVELGAFGLDVGAYPTEAIDFVLGWLFLDIYKDDRSFTDDLPEYGVGETEEEEAMPEEEAIWETRPSEEPESSLVPAIEDFEPEYGPEVVEPEGEPESTLDSEFVSPSDVDAFKRSEEEPSPDIETYESPVEPGMEEEPKPIDHEEPRELFPPPAPPPSTEDSTE
jgi:hypothetical protein